MPFGLWQQADESDGGCYRAMALRRGRSKGGKRQDMYCFPSRQVQDYRASWPWVSANRPNCRRMC